MAVTDGAATDMVTTGTAIGGGKVKNGLSNMSQRIWQDGKSNEK